MSTGVKNSAAGMAHQFNGAGHSPSAARPLPTRARRPGLIAAAVLLIVGFALAGGLLVSNAAGKTEVLVVAGPVPAGHVLGTGDVRAVSVAGDLRAIKVADLATVLGRTAAVDLVGGQLLNRDMLTDALLPVPGQSMVGLALAPGRLPGDGLAVGDRVQAIAVPATANPADQRATPPRVLATGEVFAIRVDATTAADTLVTVLVSSEAAGRLAADAAAGQVSLIKVAAPAVPAAATP
ncbi:MAG: SAF domain-containing protein [Sporichthyaceae bacterium]